MCVLQGGTRGKCMYLYFKVVKKINACVYYKVVQTVYACVYYKLVQEVNDTDCKYIHFFMYYQ